MGWQTLATHEDFFGFGTYLYLHSHLRLVRRQLVSVVKIIMNHSRPVKIILDRPKTSQPVKEFLTGRKFSTHENKSRNILKGWICTSLDGLCNSRKYPYLPHRRDFFQDPPPTPLEIPIKLYTFLSIFWPYRTPIPQEIPIPSVGVYGYFLELHNDIWPQLILKNNLNHFFDSE